MRIVIALGGNALLKRGDKPDIQTQRRNAHDAAYAVAAVARHHEVVLTHGNGPQVGQLALQAANGEHSVPLDVLDAESAGMIGYLLEQELRNQLPEREISTLLTQTEVDATDPAFHNPTKFIGPTYDETKAKELHQAKGWAVARDGDAWRRVVPSPSPQHILELRSIRTLLQAGVMVINTGGGGVPVVRQNGQLRGVEAVVDKDHASSLLARELEADFLMLLTDVDAVYQDWNTPQQRAIKQATPEVLRDMEFPAGSMGPKIAAASDFAAYGGNAAIGALTEAAAVLNGESGTHILTGAGDIRWYE